MSGNTKKKAREAAMRVIPMDGEGEAYRRRLEDFVRGYMTGHAAHTRWASKTINDYRDAVSASEAK